MDVERAIEDEFDDVTVERDGRGRAGHDGTVRYTVYCDAEEERIRERLTALEADFAFETRR